MWGERQTPRKQLKADSYKRSVALVAAYFDCLQSGLSVTELCHRLKQLESKVHDRCTNFIKQYNHGYEELECIFRDYLASERPPVAKLWKHLKDLDRRIEHARDIYNAIRRRLSDRCRRLSGMLAHPAPVEVAWVHVHAGTIIIAFKHPTNSDYCFRYELKDDILSPLDALEDPKYTGIW